MAEFFTQLFESIFTPGPTPTLVVATNVSFAALQVLLLTLVAATWNIHFMILSVLTAGLWWAINWFVRELEIAKSQSAQQDGVQGSQAAVGRRDDGKGGSGDSGSETEGDDAEGQTSGSGVDQERLRENMRLRVQNSQVHGGKRRSSLSASGTDSEWDKIDAEEEVEGK